MTSKNFCGKIRDVKRDIQKYWLLWRLRKELWSRNNTSVYGGLTYYERKNFVEFTAKRSLQRFSKILWCRKTISTAKLNWKMNEYDSIIESCVNPTEDKKYIDQMSRGGLDLIRTNNKADEILGFFPICEELLRKYKIMWTVIIIPFLLGAYGLPYLVTLIKKLLFIK